MAQRLDKQQVAQQVQQQTDHKQKDDKMESQNNNQAVLAALGYPALPQSVVPVTKVQTQIQRTQYDPVKLQAVMTALNKPRALKTRGEIIAEALANIPEERSFTGGFGEEIISPWSMALSSFARGFGSAYKAKKEDERERANEERENALKAAQLALEADKSVVTDQIGRDYLKVNDPNAKAEQEQVKKQEALNALYALKERNKQNVAGFDERFDIKNPDGTINIEKTMANYKGRNPHGIFGRNWTSPNSFWGWGESKNEADVRQKFQAFKETQIRNVYDTLRGAGAITEKELETMAKTAEKATNPYELDVAINEFIKNIEAKKEMPQSSNGKAF